MRWRNGGPRTRVATKVGVGVALLLPTTAVGPHDTAHAAFVPSPFVEVEPGEYESDGFLVRAQSIDHTSGLLRVVVEDVATGDYHALSLDAETRMWSAPAQVTTGTTQLAIASDGVSAYLAAPGGVLERRSLTDWTLLDSTTIDDRGAGTVRITGIAPMPGDPDRVVVNAGFAHGLIALDDGVELDDRVPGVFVDLDAIDGTHVFGVSSVDMGPAEGWRVGWTATGLVLQATMALAPDEFAACTPLLGRLVCQEYERTGVVDPTRMEYVAAWTGRSTIDPFRQRVYSAVGFGDRAVRRIDGAVDGILQSRSITFGSAMAVGGMSIAFRSGAIRITDLDDLTTEPVAALPGVFERRRLEAWALVHPPANGQNETDRNLVVESGHDHAYVSIASESSAGGAHILRIDAAATAASGSIPVPTEPLRLALSSDDSTLYATTVVGDIVRFDTTTLTEVGRFRPGFPLSPADDIVVVPGTVDRVIVRSGGTARLFVDGVAVGGVAPADAVLDGPTPGHVTIQSGRRLRLMSAAVGLSEVRSADIDGTLVSTANGAIWTTSASIDPADLASTPLPLDGLVPIPGSTDMYEVFGTTATRYSTEEFAWLASIDASWTDGSEIGQPLVHLGGGRFGAVARDGLALFDLTGDAALGGEYVALTPSRVLDTRTGLGQEGRAAPIGADTAIDLQLAGRGGVPSTGVAVVVANVTVTQPTTRGFLTVSPSGVDRPLISTINFPPGRTVANLATIAVGEDGRASIYNRFGAAHVVVDVVGYYTDDQGLHGGRFRGVDPRRILDTRTAGHQGGEFRPPGPVRQDDEITIDVARWYEGERHFARAAILNVTAVNPSTSTFITVYPDDVERPLAANLNTSDGRTVPNQVIVRIPASGEITLYNRWGSVDLVVDLMGFYGSDYATEGGRLVLIEPERLFDTRVESPFPGDGSLFEDSTLFFAGEPDNPYSGYILNVTVTEPTHRSFLAVHPWPGSQTTASLNFTPGLTVANHVTVAAGPGIGFYNRFGNTHVVGDLFGVFLANEPL